MASKRVYSRRVALETLYRIAQLEGLSPPRDIWLEEPRAQDYVIVVRRWGNTYRVRSLEEWQRNHGGIGGRPE